MTDSNPKFSLAWVLVSSWLIAPANAWGQLNDTGQVACANDLTVQLACADTALGTDAFPGQDAQQGRDFTDPDPDDGFGGFSFTKLDSSGTPLADQQVDYATTPWSCVEDQVTGLTWEVKTDDNGLQDTDWTYSWYNSSGVNDGGDAGLENDGACFDTANCDTEKFTAAVNAEAICGFTDWRLPNPVELMSILVFDPKPFSTLPFPLPPSVDENYFPNTQRARYWTSISSAVIPTAAHIVFFGGNTGTESKGFPNATRLVRGAMEAIQ